LRERALLALSLALNAIAIAYLAGVYSSYTQLKRHFMELASEYERAQAEIRALREQLNMTSAQLEHYRRLVEHLTRAQPREEQAQELAGRAEVQLVAVKAKPGFLTYSLEGVVLKAIVELKPGQGRVLVSTTPLIGIDLQASLRTAVEVAEQVTGASLSSTDVVVTIVGEEEMEIVDGPSAGAALTLAIIAAIRGEEMPPGIYITGTIEPGGSIGAVGGVLEKASAAAEAGARVFVVPAGQSRIEVPVPVERKLAPGFTLVVYEYKVISLEEYLRQQGYDIKVVEASTIWEAMAAVGL